MYARMTPDRYARDMRVPENYGGNAFRPAPPRAAEPPAQPVTASSGYPGPETAYSQESYRRLFREPAEPQADLPPEETEVPPEPKRPAEEAQSAGLLSGGGVGKLFGGLGQGIGNEELLLLALILLTAGDNGGDDLFLVLLLLLFIR